MRIRSPLSNLAEVLDEVKKSAETYRATLTRNEAATRAVLVDPVLRALGWETSNTNMVEVERTLAGTRVDYALYDANADVKIVVEAKALGKNLADHTVFMSLVTYAFTFGISDIFLTDGLTWLHYTDFHPGQNTPDKTIDLASHSPVASAAYLVQRLDAAKYWPEEQTIDSLAQRVAELESSLASLETELFRVKDRFVSTSPSNAADDASSPKILQTYDEQSKGFVALATLNDLTGRKPAFLRLPDGVQVTVKSWKDVLRECCKYALSTNAAISIPLPDYSGKKVNLFAWTQPAKGISFVKQEYNGRPLYIYVNYDANHAVANALYALEQAPPHLRKLEAAVALRD